MTAPTADTPFELVTAREVIPGDRISIPGMTTRPSGVEDTRVTETDPDGVYDFHAITIWPDLKAPEIPKTSATGSNFGHWYSQFMVTVDLVGRFPVRRYERGDGKPITPTTKRAYEVSAPDGTCVPVVADDIVAALRGVIGTHDFGRPDDSDATVQIAFSGGVEVGRARPIAW